MVVDFILLVTFITNSNQDQLVPDVGEIFYFKFVSTFEGLNVAALFANNVVVGMVG